MRSVEIGNLKIETMVRHSGDKEMVRITCFCGHSEAGEELEVNELLNVLAIVMGRDIEVKERV